MITKLYWWDQKPFHLKNMLIQYFKDLFSFFIHPHSLNLSKLISFFKYIIYKNLLEIIGKVSTCNFPFKINITQHSYKINWKTAEIIADLFYLYNLFYSLCLLIYLKRNKYKKNPITQIELNWVEVSQILSKEIYTIE